MNLSHLPVQPMRQLSAASRNQQCEAKVSRLTPPALRHARISSSRSRGALRNRPLVPLEDLLDPRWDDTGNRQQISTGDQCTLHISNPNNSQRIWGFLGFQRLPRSKGGLRQLQEAGALYVSCACQSAIVSLSIDLSR